MLELAPNTWYALSFLLNIVWFGYAMLNTRYIRKHVRKMETQLLSRDHLFHLEYLEHYFDKRRNKEGMMLLNAVREQIKAKTKAKKPIVTPTP
jgi:hypothetical protein